MEHQAISEMLRHRKRSASQLCVGSVLVLFAFIFAAGVNFHHHYYMLDRNFMNETFASGNNYFPQTVSESVADPTSDLGKVFFGFNMVGSMCMLLSQYPWHLHNVYTSDADRVCGAPWCNFRSFMPPLGLMLVACVQMIPHANANMTEEIANVLHQLAAAALLGGYCVLEARTLGWFRKCPRRSWRVDPVDSLGRKRFKPGEKAIRSSLIAICLIFIVLFQISGVMHKKGQESPEVPWGCCDDVWVYPQEDSFYATYHIVPLDYGPLGRQKRMLLNSASGQMYQLKVFEYVMEFLAAVFAIISHLTIWYYCDERKYVSHDGALPLVREYE